MERNSYTIADMEIQNRIKIKNHILLDFEEIIDWNQVNSLLKEIDYRNHNRTGRDSFSPETMFRIFLIKDSYNFSDRDMEEHLQYNMLFLHFCKLSISSPVPDHSTICRWRERFIKYGLYETLFTLINDQLDKQGLEIRRGGHMDATLQQSAARPRRKEVIEVEPVGDDELPENLNIPETTSTVPTTIKDKQNVVYTKTESKDPDAAWVKKGKQYTYGYKKMIVTNLNGFISSVITTPANVNDCKIAIPCIAKANLEPYSPLTGDKGFDSQEIRDYLQDNNLFDFIMRKKKRNEKHDEVRISRNKKISKVRFVVERTFGYVKLKLGGSRSRYIGLNKTHNSNVMKAIVYNLIRSVRQPIQDRCLSEPNNRLLGYQI